MQIHVLWKAHTHAHCTYVIWSHKSNIDTTLPMSPCILIETNKWVLCSQEQYDSMKVILPHFFFLFIYCCCHSLCQSILLKATAVITLGQDGWGDTVFRWWLHFILGESDAVDGRQAAPLSALLSIYRCFRALSCVYACLSQNVKLLLGLGGTVECKYRDPVFIFHFAINWLCIFYIVIVLCNYLYLKEIVSHSIIIILRTPALEFWFLFS